MRALKFLPKVVIFFVCLGCSFAWGQIEVNQNNQVEIGSGNYILNPPSQDFVVNGGTYFSCENPIFGTSGGGFTIQGEEFTASWRGHTIIYSQPVIKPSSWGGRLGKDMSESFSDVYTTELHYMFKSQFSDANFKQNIASLGGAESINTIQGLNPVSFQYTSEFWNKYGHDSVNVEPDARKFRTRRGFLAQEVENVVPEIVNQNEDGDYTLNQEELIPILTKAIQEQQAQIENLQDEIENLGDQLSTCCN